MLSFSQTSASCAAEAEDSAGEDSKAEDSIPPEDDACETLGVKVFTQ